MNQAIKEQWVAALESGDYPQGTGALCLVLPDGTKKWCCLGVLCDLAVRAGVHVGVGTRPPTHHCLPSGYKVVAYDGETALLPAEVMEWAGLERSPHVQRNGGDAWLWALNDIEIPFTEIAQLIRESL